MDAFSDPRFAQIFGISGNVVSFMVYLAPVPTFYRIIKKKSTEGFQSIPYSVALFSSMLLLYYAFLKTNVFMLVTINTIGCVIESIYLIIYLIYAPKSAKVFTIKLLLLFNSGAYGLIVVITYVLSKGDMRVTIVGWICAVFSVCVFAAPLSIIRLVIKTKSVEYMPFTLSLALTVSAFMWGFYGLALGDYFVATPNVLGILFGFTQMILYYFYKNKSQVILWDEKLKESNNGIQMSKTEKQENCVVDLNQPDQVNAINVKNNNPIIVPSGELNV
ncbi:MtN3_slv domain-containing protein [Cephalotus follicularis]|uniref:Bidirectional sugar transporter SWEET n=1 Tax=Cephalotus follicularis TaxID=3775 RepID=A0A1Q3BH62_CEPFO|nr:MtN3_slv domain-containing protein [Cephalotus follicularis]